MIAFTRAEARIFRTLLSRCVTGRPRGPAPHVAIHVRDGVRTFCASTETATLLHIAAASGERDDVMLVPLDVLATVAAASNEPVTIERHGTSEGVVTWSDRGEPQSTSIELIVPGRQHDLPQPPALVPVDSSLLTALHECGRTAARESSARFALTRVQINGRKGCVAGTDSKQALLWEGFDLPFAESVLIPALPVFGSKEWVRETDVWIGRDATHLTVAVGVWHVSLPIDGGGRLPDVAAIVPRARDASVAGLDANDAAAVLAALPGLPGENEECQPITLDLDGTLVVRAAETRSEAASGAREMRLIRSPVSGPAIRVAIDRRVLKRMLLLGCHTLRIAPGRPILAEGKHRKFLTSAFDEAHIVPPLEGVRSVAIDRLPALRSTADIERTTSMTPHETNGHTNGHIEPAPTEPPDPLLEAEALRAALADAALRAGRLVALLKNTRKEKKALASVWAGLKQLNFGSAGRGGG